MRSRPWTQQLGRLAAGVRAAHAGPAAVIVVADHGEGLGDHGEALHGNLLYQSTMHVPLVVVGPGVRPAMSDAPVSTRRVFHTLLDWAGPGRRESLRTRQRGRARRGDEAVPRLRLAAADHGGGGVAKAIFAGPDRGLRRGGDPGERRDLATSRTARSCPARSATIRCRRRRPPGAGGPRRRGAAELASLGYVSAGAAPVVRQDAPRPADMVRAVRAARPRVGAVRGRRSMRGHPAARADPRGRSLQPRRDAAPRDGAFCARPRPAGGGVFARAARLAPESPDVRLYLALHYARGAEWQRAVPLLERMLARDARPGAGPRSAGGIRERQGQLPTPWPCGRRSTRCGPRRRPNSSSSGDMAMQAGQTAAAIDAFERARAHKARLRTRPRARRAVPVRAPVRRGARRRSTG